MLFLLAYRTAVLESQELNLLAAPAPAPFAASSHI